MGHFRWQRLSRSFLEELWLGSPTKEGGNSTNDFGREGDPTERRDMVERLKKKQYSGGSNTEHSNSESIRKRKRFKIRFSNGSVFVLYKKYIFFLYV